MSQWESLQSLVPNITHHIGIPKCIAAIWTGNDFVMGSTLPDWGFLGGLVLRTEGSDQNLHDWYRIQRYMRFTEKEQLLLNKLIETEDKQRNKFDEIFKESFSTDKAQFSS